MSCVSFNTGLKRDCFSVLTVPAVALLCKEYLQPFTVVKHCLTNLWGQWWKRGCKKPACPCWKALSLFLNREGRTKSQPRASSASSFLRSGSWRRDSSLILILAPDRTGCTCTNANIGGLWSSSVPITNGTGSKRRWQSWCPSDCPLAEREALNAGEQLLLWHSLYHSWSAHKFSLSHTHTQHRVREPSPQSNRGDKRWRIVCVSVCKSRSLLHMWTKRGVYVCVCLCV